MKLCAKCTSGYADHVTTCPTHGGVLSELRELRPGMVIHKTYRIVRKLGQGGMGTVYLADQIYMHKPRALKFLSAELTQNESFTDRFRIEVQTLHEIRHPNVVDCGDLEPAEDDSLFFSMEFVDGPDLREFLDRSPELLDVPVALSIARGIAKGLGAAHARGMVHRDIKPENILLSRDGDGWLPKIADFGIVATKESGRVRTSTMSGGTLLTLAYAAPEQWRGTRSADLDNRTDLYALGGVLFELLTRQTVFNGESYAEWSQLHRNIPPQPPSMLRPDLAHWQGLDALVLKLLAKDREMRPKDVAEVLSLIDAVKYVAPKPPVTASPTPKLWGIPENLAISIFGALLLAAMLGAFAAYRAGVSSRPIPVAESMPRAYGLLGGQKYAEAAQLFEQACNQENRFACNELGWLYQVGNGVPQSYSRAKDLYYKSCHLGHPEGCSNLGVLYSRGDGVPRDVRFAMNLYQRACAEGGDDGCRLLIKTDVYNWPSSPWWSETDYWEHEMRPFLNVGCSSGGQEACRLLRCRSLGSWSVCSQAQVFHSKPH